MINCEHCGMKFINKSCVTKHLSKCPKYIPPKKYEELQAENDKLKECLRVIKIRFKEKVENNESYLVEMKKVCQNEEFYDKAQTNIMDTKDKLVLYRWFYKKATEALKG